MNTVIEPYRATRIAFTVFGKAQPGGSKKSMPIYVNGKPLLKDGRVIVNTVDANPHVADWKHTVAYAARQVYRGEVLDGPIRLTVKIFRARPESHYGSGRNADKLKPSAPAYPTSAPDTTKCVRAIEDGLNKVLWTDDARVVDQHASKVFAEKGDPERVEIVIEALGGTEQEPDQRLF